MAETLGGSFTIDVTNLKAGLAQANRLIRESESEFKAAAAGMDDWSGSADGLEAQIKNLNTVTDLQSKKVDALQSEYDRLIAEGLDPASAQAVKLRTDINKETEALNKNKKALDGAEKSLDELGDSAEEAADDTKDAGDAADAAGESFNGLKSAAKVGVAAIAAVGAAAVGAVTAFLGLAESTRETRTQMGKLETSFETAGLSAQDAESTFTDLYGVLGDEGKASESAAFLAKYADDEKELAAQTRILTGVFAQYGDSIPTEGLAEGIASTISMGETQGVLADALEWQGVNLEDFNAQLAELTTEQEREALITETLNGLYGESADAYAKNNADVIAANKAQASLNSTLATLGAIAEPIMTQIKTLAAGLLESITPFVSIIGEGLTGALNGAEGATDQLAEGINGLISTILEKAIEMLPQLIDIVLALFPQLLTTVLEQLPVVLDTLIYMVGEVVKMLAEMLPTLLPEIINAVIMIAETLIDNIDMIIDAGISLILGLAEGLIAALPDLVEKIPVIIEKIIMALANNLPKLLEMGVTLIVKLAAGLIKAIPQLIKSIPQIITSLIKGFTTYYSKIGEIGKNIVTGIWEGISGAASWLWDKITGWVGGLVGGIMDFLGIKSPSKVMADSVGANMALGIGEGFDDEFSSVEDKINNSIDGLTAGGINANINGLSATDTGSTTAGGVVVNQVNNYSQAHSRYEIYQSQQKTASAVKLALMGV